VFTTAGKALVSNAITGTGNVVMSTSPTLVTPALGTPASGVVTNLTGTASININGTVGATTPAAGTFTSLSDSGNLTFTGTGNRITGDFSNATIANRVGFQSSTTNGNTDIQVLPNGTAVISGIRLHNASDVTNASFLRTSLSTASADITSGISGTGTYLPMSFYTGGSERMRIDTSGNVGIGTSSPAKRLSVVNATDSTTVGANAVMTVQAGSSVNSVAEIGFAYGTWSDTNPICSVGYQITSNAGVGAGALTFSTRSVTTDTAPTERMRIDSSGNLLVGTTTNSDFSTDTRFYAVHSGSFVSGFKSTGGASTIPVNIWNTGSSGTINLLRFYDGVGNVRGTVTSDGSVLTYGGTSDYRLKENIAPMVNGLERVLKLKPVTYVWKENSKVSEGFIAHELQTVVPDAVSGQKDEVDADGKPVYQNIDPRMIVAVLTAAIQEQQAIIESLKSRLDAAGL
jgi:hypothetical protein